VSLEHPSDSGSIVVALTAARVQPGTTLLVEIARRRWVAPGCSWHGQPLVRPVAHLHGAQTVVQRTERESTALSRGSATEVIIWTDRGVLVCTPSTLLHSLKTS